MVKIFLCLCMALNISCAKDNELQAKLVEVNASEKIQTLHLQGRFKINYPSQEKTNQELDLYGQAIIKKPIPETLLGNYQFDKNNSESGENTEKLTLASPLGETLLIMVKTTDSLTLWTGKNQTILYLLPDELPLFYQQIGFELPITKLSEWLTFTTESFNGNWRIIPKNKGSEKKEAPIFHKYIIENKALDIELVLLVE